MDDKKFDQIIKSKLQKSENIPDDINSLFSNFERKIIMDNKEKKKIGFFKYSVAIVSILTILSGGCVFAHINGLETLISPLLRNLGINSKYEDEKINLGDKIYENNVDVKLLDVAIDGTSMIVGYQINIDDNCVDNWAEISGEYKINDLHVKPINQLVDKDENGVYILYQLFDMNEINLKDKKEMLLDFNILNIRTYAEYEDLNNVYANYNNSYDGNWHFNKSISITNNKPTEEYLLNSNSVTALKSITIKADSLIVGAYTNILKIKTNKENYKGDSFEVYYKISDQNNNEIIIGSESREYDDRIYNDRLALGDISLEQKITIKIYLKTIDEEVFREVGSIFVNLDQKQKKLSLEEGYNNFNGEEYSFKYKNNWKNLGIATKDQVGPNSIYNGYLRLEIPATANLEYSSWIFITSKKGETLKTYLEKVKKNYLDSTDGIEYILKEEEKYKDGYKIILESTDGENIYNDVIYVFENNNTVCEINFSGTEIEYNNLEDEIENLVNSFNIKN